MLLWIGLAALTALALIGILRPLLSPAKPEPSRAAFDIAIFRDQLDEITRDQARGALSAAEAASARLEIERRLLAAVPKDAQTDAAPLTPRPARWAALAVILLVPAGAVLLYLRLGAPDLPDQPLAARAAERALLNGDGALDLNKARAGLEAKLKTEPNSLEGWLLLARTDGALGDWAAGKAAFERALTLSQRQPEILEDYGDLLVGEAEGKVTPQAVALFQESLNSADRYRARFYIGLFQAQNGDYPGAIAAWQGLLRDAPADANWLSTVRDSIAQAKQAAGLPPDPPAVVAPAGMAAGLMSLPPEQRNEAIRGMVAGLAAKLAANPNDLDGWKRLARSYDVLGEPDKARDAYAHASALAPDDADLRAHAAK